MKNRSIPFIVLALLLCFVYLSAYWIQKKEPFDSKQFRDDIMNLIGPDSPFNTNLMAFDTKITNLSTNQ